MTGRIAGINFNVVFDTMTLDVAHAHAQIRIGPSQEANVARSKKTIQFFKQVKGTT